MERDSWTYAHSRLFKYDRKLNAILFRAAWEALSQVLGVNKAGLAAILTVQTAG